MAIFSKISGFVDTRFGKFILAGAIVMGPLFVTKFIKQKLVNWRLKLANEYMERTRKQRQFEIVHHTFGDFILKQISSINKTLHEAVDSESIIADIRNQPEKNAELWDKILKTLVFTKITCLVYFCTMLVVTTRIQMHVLGGCLYNNTDILSSEEQKRYLGLSKNVLDTGLHYLKELVLKECGKILTDLPLSQGFNIIQVENLFQAIQTALHESSNSPIKKLKEILLGDTQISAADKIVYNAMMFDTCDLLESEEIKNLTSASVTLSLSLVSYKLSEYYVPPPSANSNDSSVHPSLVEIPLVNLISIINGLLSKNDLSGQLVRLLINDIRLKTLDANIYEAFSLEY